jgi:ribosomal protein L7/L12
MEITKELASQILIESETFRQYVLAQALQNDPYSLVNKIKRICNNNATNKIAAIKAVRELSRDTPESEFKEAYGVCYSSSCLGLAESKMIVEKYIKVLDGAF